MSDMSLVQYFKLHIRVIAIETKYFDLELEFRMSINASPNIISYFSYVKSEIKAQFQFIFVTLSMYVCGRPVFV